MKPRMSCFVTRPPMPDARESARYRRCAPCAIRRTSGEDYAGADRSVGGSVLRCAGCAWVQLASARRVQAERGAAASFGCRRLRGARRGGRGGAAARRWHRSTLASAPFPAAPIVATTLLTAPSRPPSRRSRVSDAGRGDGISASTLSVEISNSGSSRSTLSPTFLIQRTMVPSAIDSPICGITTGVDIAESFSRSGFGSWLATGSARRPQAPSLIYELPPRGRRAPPLPPPPTSSGVRGWS